MGNRILSWDPHRDHTILSLFEFAILKFTAVAPKISIDSGEHEFNMWITSMSWLLMHYFPANT